MLIIINLSFDTSFPETEAELERFKALEIADQFKYQLWDGIPTYQLDLIQDLVEIIITAKDVVQKVYLQDLSIIVFDEFEI